ncbi:MAG: hypothetical protein QOJ35_3480 [Solirubrobacteraceae bacterium]|nr:hypothetical protein [Solirubrobacteraceae bacterium]
MPARTALRRRLRMLPAAALIMVTLPVTGALAQAPGLPRTYKATRIDSPTPVGGGSFGWGIWSADLTGDHKQDLLVAQGQIGTAAVPTKAFIFNGATGALVDTINPPEDNPLEPQLQPAPPAAPVPPVYHSPEMAFVYIETMPDIGSCPGGDGPDADKICDDAVIGPKDDIPEILVGSRALRVNVTDGSIPAHVHDPNNGPAATPSDPATDPIIGRGYVLDGATRVVLKRIDMPAADRQLVLARLGANGGPAFGRTMSSPQGMPPCAGPRGDNNDEGVGPCPAISHGYANTTMGSNTLTNVDLPEATNGQMLVGLGLPLGTKIVSGGGTSTLTVLTPPTSGPLPLGAGATMTNVHVPLTASDPRYTQAVRIGDLDGGGQPDIVITSRGFPETKGPAGSAPAGSECKANTTPITPATANCGAGKVWTYRGEDIVGSNPRTILDTTMFTPSAPTCTALPTDAVPCRPNGGLQNPDAQANPAGGEFGGNLFRVGDLAGDDGLPDFVIPYRGADFPLKSPDINAGLNMGSAYLYNGRTGSVARTIVSPEPQIRSQFSGNFNAGRAVGDVGATDTPDILLPAALQNVAYVDQGRLWAFNGDLTAGGGGEQSWNLAMLNDPEPSIGGSFGGGLTGVGNLVDGPGAPANEVLVGGNHFDTFTEASQDTVPDVNFMNVTLDKNLMTIPHPEGVSGDGFGVGITPMGDLNGDGFLDFAVSAYLADGPVGAAGRAWIFKSDNSPAPAPPAQPAPAASGPVTPATADKLLQAGACTNRTVGTDAGETLRGTIAGDEMWGFAGNDTVTGYQGDDCIDAGPGNDTVRGGDGRDKLIGAGGGDLLYGGDGRDELYGGFRNDRLYGGYGRDMIAGGSGDDLIVGGPDADRLFGESGKDRIIAGDGRNFIDGGDGNDSIDSHNGEQDRVICGKGRHDRVYADRIDRLNGCEIVTFSKPPKSKGK